MIIWLVTWSLQSLYCWCSHHFPNFSFHEVIERDPKRKCWTLTSSWLNFLGSSITSQGFSCWVLWKKEQSLGVGCHPAEVEMAEFSTQSGWCPASWLLWRVFEVYRAPLGRQGHPIPWGEVQTEVSAVGALTWGSDSRARCGDVLGAMAASFGNPICPFGLISRGNISYLYKVSEPRLEEGNL